MRSTNDVNHPHKAAFIADSAKGGVIIGCSCGIEWRNKTDLSKVNQPETCPNGKEIFYPAWAEW